MPLGETCLGAVLGAVLNVLFDRLTSPELWRFLCQQGFEAKIDEWANTLGDIDAVLRDAEEKQLTDRRVKKWLDDLEELAYDVEDILDEFEYEATARKIKMDEPQSSNWICSMMSLDASEFPNCMSTKLDDVTTRFDRLRKRRRYLGLQDTTGGAPSRSRLPTSAHRTEPAVCGRDEDTKKLLQMVLKNEPTDGKLLVIPIVGMGGVGKTTLAREVFIASEAKFEVKAWVCVSDREFDVTGISKSILENITGSSSLSNDLATVQDKLKKRVLGKKFLLVLDDVWSGDYDKWQILQSPFRASAVGSRIIVTTRDERVARGLNRNKFHQVSLLKPEDCWSVFISVCAFENESIPAHHDIKLIREKVIEKSKRLPLAAKTLGGLLRSKKTDEWLGLLDSKLWDLPEEDGNKIPAALKLSYHHLPSHLRRCFAYCSIFPKDHEFEIEDVVLLWIAEGLVQQSTEDEQPEELGYKYFSDLLGRSLFQQSSSDNGHKFVMHDLIHDLAQWAFGERSLRLEDVSAANRQLEGLKKVRHFSYTSGVYDGEKRFKVFQEDQDLMARIRTFLPIPRYYDQYITRWCPVALLPKLKRLRVLSLQKYRIVEVSIPTGGLKHLRYLNLSNTQIRSLPESTSLLYNLQILLLRRCSYLEKWPSNFKYLIKLRHLDIKGAIKIKEMPLEMEKLQNLQKLSDFIVGEGVRSGLKDLMSLSMLHGKLRISRLNNVSSCDHKILSNKKDLMELSLEWGYLFDKSRSEVTEEKVLTMLQPHEYLRELTIKGYGGTKLPRWVGDASYSNMKVLKFIYCEKCTDLPSLGALGSLEKLIIKGMERLPQISSEFYGNGQPFKSLKTLCFEEMSVWEVWEQPTEEKKYGDAFPCLKKLSIKRCPQLSRSLPRCLSALEELVIKQCKQLVVSFPNIPKLCKLNIDGCRRIACDNPVDFKSIRYLSLSNISEFSNQLMQECFGKPELPQIRHNRLEDQLDEIRPEKPPVAGLQSIRFLTELVISKCSNIVSFPEVCSLPHLSKLQILNCYDLIFLPEEMKIKNTCLESLEISVCRSLAFIVRGQLPPSLKTLKISYCKKLESLWDDRENDKNTNSSLLESLSIKWCDSLTFIVRGQLPPSLKWLEIDGCKKLKSLWDDRENDNDTNSPLVEYLSIFDCPSLTCLSSSIQLPATLEHVEFHSCPQLTKLSQSGLLPASLKHLSFVWCGQLSTITEGFHDSNTSLEVIEILECKNLQITNALHNFRHLRDLTIMDCPSIECFPEGGLAATNLRRLLIICCAKLKALPIGLRSLNSLEDLNIQKCPSIASFNPEEEFPTNLKSLVIAECENVCRPLLEWGLHNLISLTSLSMYGIPQQEMEIMFPPSLTYLSISGFPKLTSQGFQNLTSLQSLDFNGCPNLTSLGDQGLPSSLEFLRIWNSENLTCFPKQGLPSSLLSLKIYDCPKLEEECKRNKGREWSKISNIPKVWLTGRHIFELEDDEKA